MSELKQKNISELSKDNIASIKDENNNGTIIDELIAKAGESDSISKDERDLLIERFQQERGNLESNIEEKKQNITDKTKTGLNNIHTFMDNLIKFKNISIASGEWFEKYLSLAINLSSDKQNKIFNIINTIGDVSKCTESCLDDFEKYIEKKGLNNIDSVEDFIKNFEIYIPIDFKKETGDKFKETGDKFKETGDKFKETGDKFKETINETVSYLKQNKLDKEFSKEIDALENANTPELQREAALALLEGIKKKALDKSIPENERKKYTNTLKHISISFHKANIISDKDFIDIQKLIGNKEEIKEDKENHAASINILKVEKYNKIPGSDVFLKSDKNTDEVATIDSKGKVSEKVVSSSSGYSIPLEDKFTLPPDIGVIKNNIEDTKRKIVDIEKILVKISDIEKKSETDRKPEEKKMLEYKAGLEDKKKELQLRLEDYIMAEADAKKKKEEFDRIKLDRDRQKEIIRKRLECLDESKITKYLPKEIIDALFSALTERNGTFAYEGINQNIDLNDIESMNTNIFKKLLCTLLGVDMDNLYDTKGDIKMQGMKDTKKYFLELLGKEPKAFDDGKINIENIKSRLMSNSSNSFKNIN